MARAKKKPRSKPTKPPKPKPPQAVFVTEKGEVIPAQLANDNLREKGGVIHVNGRDVNVGGSPYTRWKASGQITPAQERAVEHCLRLWELTGVTGPAITAGYGERIPSGQRCEPEWLVIKILQAREDLARVEGYFNGIRSYWDVFENCVRHDEPAGRAGSRIMGWGNGTAIAKALVTVQFVADIIADRERLVA